MTKTLVTNVSDGPATLPAPYHAILKRGSGGVIADTNANVMAALGGATAVQGVFTLSEVPDGNATTITPIGAAEIPAGAVGTAELAALAVTKAKTLTFISAEVIGDGTAQATAHGLAVVPASVMIALTGGPGAYTQPSIVGGAHTDTNVIATVTTGWKYRIFAWG